MLGRENLVTHVKEPKLQFRHSQVLSNLFPLQVFLLILGFGCIHDSFPLYFLIGNPVFTSKVKLEQFWRGELVTGWVL